MEWLEGRARPPGGPNEAPQEVGPPGGRPLPQRINLNHATPSWVKPGAMFFITVCCECRGENQLCMPAIASTLLDAAQFYHDRGDWFCRLFLLMPDHVHALIAPAPDKDLRRMVADWKRFTAQKCEIVWQKNFFDHRLRSDESWDEKANYIRQNPVRAGLMSTTQPWPHLIENW
jgi:putative transposase